MQLSREDLDRMDTEERDEYWADIHKFAQFIIIDFDLEKKSIPEGKEFAPISKKIWEVMGESKWVNKIARTFAVIRYTDHLILGLQEALRDENKDLNDIIRHVAAFAMAADVAYQLSKILEK